MVPTPKALSMQQPINDILRQLEVLLEPDVFTPQTYKGVFTISATDYATQALLPQLFNLTRREAPNLKLIVRDFALDNLHQLIAADELDLLLTSPEFIPDNLEEAIAKAVHHHPTLRLANLDLESARAQHATAEAPFAPSGEFHQLEIPRRLHRAMFDHPLPRWMMRLVGVFRRRRMPPHFNTYNRRALRCRRGPAIKP